MTRKRPLVPLLLAAAALLCLAACVAPRSGSRSEPGTSWESIATLPDFGGWWEWQFTDDYRIPGPDGRPVTPPHPFKWAPLLPEVKAIAIEAINTVGARIGSGAEETSAALLDDVSGVCLPPAFFGVNAMFVYNFEILFTPGRVTIANEAGLTRRVALGQPLPDDVEESNAGTSVGQWEGDTLVVETAGLNGSYPVPGFFPLGKGARTIERFRLVEPDVLEVQLALTAPELLEDVYRHTYRYQRRRDHVFHEELTCDPHDRSIDHERRTQRFDLTPPPDLPPPPGA